MAQNARQVDVLPAKSEAVVSVRQLSFRFGKHVVLDNIDLDIPPGQFIAILGRSGSGKHSFLRALAGLDTEGFHAKQLRVTKQRSVVLQETRLLPWKSLQNNVTFGLKGPNPISRARDTLAEVGLAGRESSWPGELSGGELKRVDLARAIAREPELLLADEPFGALDAPTRLRMHELLIRLCQRHRPAVLLVTDDIDEAIHLADRIIVLNQGHLTVDTPVNLPLTYPHRAIQAAELRAYLLDSLGGEIDERENPEYPFATA